MPRSKHRRKPGAKAIRNPGRDKAPAPTSLSRRAEDTAWRQFLSSYRDEVRQAFPSDQDDETAFMAELIVDAVFRFDAGGASLVPASKKDVISIFADEIDPDDPVWKGQPPEQYAPEMAEAMLARLVTHGLLEIENDQIAVPSRFLHRRGNQAATTTR